MPALVRVPELDELARESAASRVRSNEVYCHSDLDKINERRESSVRAIGHEAIKSLLWKIHTKSQDFRPQMPKNL
jgi:hypothetical protein